jgi:hypothetical protein
LGNDERGGIQVAGGEIHLAVGIWKNPEIGAFRSEDVGAFGSVRLMNAEKEQESALDLSDDF